MSPSETRQQFEQRFGTEVFVKKLMVAMHCSCEADGGPVHWTAICNTPEAIEEHLDAEECLDDLRKLEST